jgi:hypothetical protein
MSIGPAAAPTSALRAFVSKTSREILIVDDERAQRKAVWQAFWHLQRGRSTQARIEQEQQDLRAVLVHKQLAITPQRRWLHDEVGIRAIPGPESRLFHLRGDFL